jgi:molybdopterin synthase sulfur carrier subunit
MAGSLPSTWGRRRRCLARPQDTESGTLVLVEHLTTLRYWAALKEAAGVAEEKVAATTLAAALAEARARHSDRFGEVLDRCSLLVDGAQVAGRDPATVDLTLVDDVDCLPPFAGG